MKGLVLKDLIALKSYGRTTLVIVLLYAVIGFSMGNISFLTSMVIVFCAMIPMSSISVDDQAKWGAYAQCMPVTRKQLVLSKYLQVLIIAAAGIVFSLLVALLTSLRMPLNWEELLASSGLMLGLVIIMDAISIPAMFKMGVDKARMVVLLVFIACWAPIMLFLTDTVSLESVLQIAAYALPIAAVALFVGSYFVSLRIYNAKEL